MFPHMSKWSTLRTVLAITITVSLWWGSTVWSVRVGAQGDERRAGKPRREKPEGALPDLSEVQRESAQRLLFLLGSGPQLEAQPRVKKVSQGKPKLELSTTVFHSEYCSSSSRLILTLRLNYKNVGTAPILLQKKSSVIGRYMISRSLRKAANRDYVNEASFTIDWTAAGFTTDTPELSAFSKLRPGESFSAESKLPIPVFEKKEDLQAGSYFLQVKVSTWYYPPDRSEEFRERWKQEGFLWTATITSNPMAFEVKRGQLTGPCDENTQLDAANPRQTKLCQRR